MALFINTFRNLMRWKGTLIYLIIISIVPTILGFVFKYEIYRDTNPLLSQINQTMGIYYIIQFMWVLGVPFLLNASAKGVSLINDEITDGTLSLLVSMKISRFKILFYKWLALYISMIMIGIVSIFLSFSLMTLVSNMDYNIKIILIKSIPNLIKYLFLLAFLITTVSILFSLLIKSKINAILILMVFIILVFLASPLLKMFLVSYYERFYLYYFDFNYHFSLIFYNFIHTNSIFPPETQMIMGIFMGIFNLSALVDNDISKMINTSIFSERGIVEYLNVNYLIIFWILLGIICLVTAIRILIRRDIT